MKQTKRMVGWLVAGTAALSLGLVPLAAADPGTLSENESAELSFMREEERLARDLYQAFADKYDGARPFSMIVSTADEWSSTWIQSRTLRPAPYSFGRIPHSTLVICRGMNFSTCW